MATQTDTEAQKWSTQMDRRPRDGHTNGRKNSPRGPRVITKSNTNANKSLEKLSQGGWSQMPKDGDHEGKTGQGIVTKMSKMCRK